MTEHEEHEGRESSIWQTAVSLGHLAIAIAGIVIAGATYLISNERAMEKRFTTLEIRQQANLEYIVRDQQDMAGLRRETVDRLNNISQEITLLRIDIVKHQASTDQRPSLTGRP